MIRYVLRRLVTVAVSLLVLITISFALVSLIPGDPARVVAGNFATPDQVDEIRHQLGLDQPLVQRYLDYLTGVLHGDLGTSLFTNTSVGHSMLIRLPNTLVILVPGLLLALLLGLVLGSIGAYLRWRFPDRLVGVYITVAQAIPEFVIGLILIYVLFYELGLAPAPIGIIASTETQPPKVTGSIVLDAMIAGDWSTLRSIAAHAMLPVLTLAIFLSTYFAKTVRTGMSQALRSQQIEFARACGLSPRMVFGYAISSVRGSLLTYLVILFGASLGGVAILEIVFSWPGIGNWSLQGIIKGDIPIIQGFVLVLGVSTLLLYVLLDVIVVLLDPRLKGKFF